MNVSEKSINCVAVEEPAAEFSMKNSPVVDVIKLFFGGYLDFCLN